MSGNIQAKLNQAMSQLQSFGLDTKSGKCSSGENSEFVNSIFGLVQDGQAAIEANDEQKAQSIKNIVEGLLNMISFASNQTSKANKEVKTNSDAIDKNTASADKKAKEVEAKVKSLVAGIGTNTDNISNAMDIIKDLGDVSLKNVQEEIQKQLDIIDQAKKDLESPEKREDALKTIKTAADAINGFVQNIQNIQTSIEAQNAVVEENVDQISNQITESATAISEGVADIQEYIQNGTALGAQATQITVQGNTDVPVGNAEIKLGEGINSNAVSAIASGGQGAKLIMDGNQRVSAGQTRIKGGAKNLQSLTQSIGKMGQDTSSLADFTNAIGKVGEGIVDLVGQYDALVTPYIEATGSWDVDTINSENTLLQTQVESFEGTQATDIPEQEQTQQKPQNTEFTFETEKMRKAFGI